MTSWLSRLRSAASPRSGIGRSGSSSATTDAAKVHRAAREFGEYVQHVLNATICHDVKISAVVSPKDRNVVIVAKGLTKTAFVGEPFPMSLRAGKARAWLDLSFRFCFDPEGEYLTVLSSFVAIYGDPDGELRLCHFDYERDKADGYPDAHIQVYGDSPVLRHWGDELLERGLHRLHFPAGHRRFRWCLEDVIEFIVREGIAEARPGWTRVIEPGRRDFHRLQLKAAIRRDVDTAITYLREEGYAVIPPERQGEVERPAPSGAGRFRARDR